MTTTVSFGRVHSSGYFRRSHSQASLVISRLHAGPTNTMTSSSKNGSYWTPFFGGKHDDRHSPAPGAGTLAMLSH